MEKTDSEWNSQQIRTDLALEAREGYSGAGSLKGVIFEEHYHADAQVKVTKLEILNPLGEKQMGKAKGQYYTFETLPLSENDGEFHREVSEMLAGYLKEMISKLLKDKKPPYHVLTAGLGNREATPDALGPYVVHNLQITRNFENQVDNIPFAYISALIPGVMAQTGMETAEILKGIAEKTKPDCILVVDALAARSTHRLANTIQLSDTGIMPGSGVGNHRNAIDRRTMGVPVLAIGVPTVVDAATIVEDAMNTLMESLEGQKNLRGMKSALDSFTVAERKQFMWELIPDNMAGMYVTPKDVDETVKRISFTLSEAINICMSGDI